MAKIKLTILSYDSALKFFPIAPTYAIRIFSTAQKPKPLLESSNWTHISEYTFDEETKEEYESMLDEITKQPLIPATLFTEDTAQKIILDFLPYKTVSESMMIHCVGGHCRSKSIGRAMNEIFSMGNSLETFLNPHGEFVCQHFYKIMLKEAKKLRLFSS